MVVWVPTIILFLTVFVPLAIFNPKVLLKVEFNQIIARFIEDLLTFTIIFWFTLSKRKAVVLIFGIGYAFFLPYILTALMFPLSIVYKGSFITKTFSYILKILFPTNPLTTLPSTTPSPNLLPITGFLFIILQVLLIIYVTERLEVK